MNRTARVALGTTAALGALGATEALLWMALLAQWHVVQDPAPTSLAEALTLVILAAAAVLGAWLAVSTLAAMLAHLPGRLGVLADRVAGAWAPALSRRVAAVLVGAAMGGALAPGTAVGDRPNEPPAASPGLTPGFRTTSPHDGRVEAVPGVDAPRSTVGRGTAAGAELRSPGFALTLPTPAESGAAPPPAPGWTPSRPVQRPQPAPSLVTSGSESHHGSDIVVHRGDTLWDIARRHLGPDATDAEVAHAWPAWHEANRAVIGDDPAVILPGQILRPPSPAASSVRHTEAGR